ncbi:MAG: DNA translocase FtsK 4TM domain-containing protein, partial [Salinibacter sp.]
MAASGSDTKTDGNASAYVISPRRKVEIFGLVLMVLALLLSLAFISYHPGDNAVLRSAEVSEVLFNPQSARPQVPVENVLGLIGAQLARRMVPGFMGYCVLLLSGLLMVWGYAIFRQSRLRRLVYPSILTALSAFVLSVLLGWFDHTLDASLTAWAGLVGIGAAGWMQNVFGEVGSFILLLSAATVMLLLVVDHESQQTVDRVIEAFRAVGAGLSAALDSVKTQWSAARAREERKDDPHSSEPSSPETGLSSSVDSSSSPSPSDATSDAPSEPPAAKTLHPPDTPTEDRPLRRNDLFRLGTASSSAPPDEDRASSSPSSSSS